MVPESQGHSATRSTSQLSWPPSLPSAADRLRNRFPTNTGQLSPSVSTMVSTPAGRAPPCKNTKTKCNGGCRWEGAGKRGRGGSEGGGREPNRARKDETPDGGGRYQARPQHPVSTPASSPAPRIPPPPQTRAQAPRDPHSPKFRFSKTLNLNADRVRGELFAAYAVFKVFAPPPRGRKGPKQGPVPGGRVPAPGGPAGGASPRFRTCPAAPPRHRAFPAADPRASVVPACAAARGRQGRELRAFIFLPPLPSAEAAALLPRLLPP